MHASYSCEFAVCAPFKSHVFKILLLDPTGTTSVCTDLGDVPQCCTAGFLTRANKTAESSFKRALREELEDSIEAYQEFLSDLNTCE